MIFLTTITLFPFSCLQRNPIWVVCSEISGQYQHAARQGMRNVASIHSLVFRMDFDLLSRDSIEGRYLEMDLCLPGIDSLNLSMIALKRGKCCRAIQSCGSSKNKKLWIFALQSATHGE